MLPKPDRLGRQHWHISLLLLLYSSQLHLLVLFFPPTPMGLCLVAHALQFRRPFSEGQTLSYQVGWPCPPLNISDVIYASLIFAQGRFIALSSLSMFSSHAFAFYSILCIFAFILLATFSTFVLYLTKVISLTLISATATFYNAYTLVSRICKKSIVTWPIFWPHH